MKRAAPLATHRCAPLRWATSLATRGVVCLSLTACSSPVPTDMSPQPGPPIPRVPAPTPVCAAHDNLGDLEWLPADLRLAVIVDLDSADLAAAIVRLQDGARAGRGLPVVAGLGLAQLGLQLGILRPQLATAGLDPRELLLLHDRDGAVVWVLRARCDLDTLQAKIAETWSLQVRSVAGGALAEQRTTGAPRFAFDVAFLADDRIALTPPGSAGALRRWLSSPAAAPVGGPAGPSPREVLAEIPAAPIRGVLTGRSLQSPGSDAVPLVRRVRATADALEVDGVP